MRYVTVELRPVEAVHPVEAALAEAPSVTREAIHDVKRLEDGTVALLTEVGGDLDRYDALLEEHPMVLTHAVAGEQSGYCYSQIEPTPLLESVMRADEEAGFVVEMPIEYTADGAQRLTLVGRAEDLAAVRDLPGDLSVELVETGPYRPDATSVFGDLTDRQREVLETALGLGYYENPRQATHADIAAELGIEPSTVGSHLRRIEALVFGRYVR